MIYLVSKNRSLFKSTKYEIINFNDGLNLFNNTKLIQFDTETEGLDAHTKNLLTIQLGTKDTQVVFDWTTMSVEERNNMKDFLESDIILLGVNLMFDLCFMYANNIWPKKVWDIMIAEQLIYLGYPKILSNALYRELEIPGYEQIVSDDGGINWQLSYGLKAIAKRRCNIDIDKTVRGKIINEGLTEEVIVYAGGDVMWLEDIKEAQDKELDAQDLQKALAFECEALKSIAYFKHCGLHLDVDRWSAKMDKDRKALIEATEKLNDWVVNWDMNRKDREDFDIQYPELNILSKEDLTVELIRLKKEGYIRSYIDDLTSPEGRVQAFKKRVKDRFTTVEPQGDLFSGFNTKRKCLINWESSKQVIPLFEALGINCTVFDKKEKRKKKSIKENVLSPQANDFEILPLFLEYQKASKVVSTYGQNWLNAINPKTNRIHAELHLIGTDTARVSSGGGVYKLNLQNLPHDAETRACFTAEKGNKWLSCDFTGQESCLTASVSKDAKMCEILNTGGDLHSEVAKACWPELLGNLTDKEIKEQYKAYRQDAKGVEFGIFYGGDDNTLVQNKGFKPDIAKRIYNNFMATFSGIKKYQDSCRAIVMSTGIITLNPITKHKAHIFDFSFLDRVQKRFSEDGFWGYYREMKQVDPGCDTVKDVRKYFERKAESERQSINYRIQGRGSACFKLASIKFFNWIVSNNYQNIVKMCVPVHDEINAEAPEEMAEEVGKILVQCMIDGGKPFCPGVFLGADISINDHWVH